MAIQRVLSDYVDVEDLWKLVEEPETCQGENSKLELKAHNTRDYEYRIRIHDGLRTCRWIPAAKQIQGQLGVL